LLAEQRISEGPVCDFLARGGDGVLDDEKAAGM
jgi:hypothetical protein